MRGQGFTTLPKHGRKPRVAAGRQGMLSKIEALLASAGRPWGYLDDMVARMLGEKRPVEWLDDAQVRQLMQMLIMDAKRHGRLCCNRRSSRITPRCRRCYQSLCSRLPA
ncbi:MAG: phage protein GemA/Gp16 family protein [Sodalis sp. (in: enterobacteria)]|uniref:phage protein GemA/Gp16 family protein n=1 Tax=Sodalis sp. (in: enterobacteria) TaxID=1898979 RepID=UPI0039E45A8D